ncbi:hypothetical protein NEDG_01651 [Nematocida displodere]|uniref:Uncharacterized protein n=1 Tax=Nematocida displodere TaxID=1805483 RepID=A0A177EH88_9MICR|nr:hypothetical protein NEDG_01651 [Nematocida displodere]
MLSHFHFLEEAPREKAVLYGAISLEDTITLPSLEEVDSLPEAGGFKSQDLVRLEKVGMGVLSRVYSGEEASVVGIKCKGLQHEQFRLS